MDLNSSTPADRILAPQRDVEMHLAADLGPDSVVVANPESLSADLDKEAVILHLQAGVYFGMNEVAARVWSLIQEPRRLEAIVDALTEEFEVERDRCETDAKKLLGDFLDHGLAEIRDGTDR